MRQQTKQKQMMGFTLIELIVVIIIVGILSAVALPRFVDLGSDAGNAAAKGTIGEISSSSKMNFGKAQASGTAPIAVTSATTCSALSGLLEGGFPTDVSVVNPTDTLASCTGAGKIDNSCSIKHSKGTSTGFVVPVVCSG